MTCEEVTKSDKIISQNRLHYGKVNEIPQKNVQPLTANKNETTQQSVACHEIISVSPILPEQLIDNNSDNIIAT